MAGCRNHGLRYINPVVWENRKIINDYNKKTNFIRDKTKYYICIKDTRLGRT